MRRAVVIGYGAYLPQRIVTNTDLESRIDTTHTWIAERTGIHQRHIAAEGELTSALAAKAAKAALDKAGAAPDTVDTLILATTTPDDTMPSSATKVQHALDMHNGAAFDVAAACSGFIYALHLANALIVSGQSRRALVIGAETFSRIIDWSDRGTCILFGDGAGALLLEAQEGKGDTADRGILAASIASDGRYYDILRTSGGVSSTQVAGTVSMAGKEVFRHAVDKMAGSVLDALAKAGLDKSAIDWVVPHQANVRILDATARRLGVPEEKLISTVRDHANTSAASIPLALCAAAAENRLKEGDLLAMPALGAGLTWGACILRW
jgi:3-oxoacyl-[acyl-carrier-protein] synthase-3